ncbi:MAG: ArsR/SmtB family transcription factor [Flavobacteriales bacterium]
MGVTKTENFTEAQNSLASIAKVLGHPARVAILDYIMRTQSCVCGSIVDEIGLAQSTISQHLKELKRVGLIQGTIEGTSVCYCIDIENWNNYKNQFSRLFDSVNEKGVCC